MGAYNSLHHELEVFICGGNYDYKKASLDVGKIQETGDGQLMVRVNIPVELCQYKVFVPKKLI